MYQCQIIHTLAICIAVSFVACSNKKLETPKDPPTMELLTGSTKASITFKEKSASGKSYFDGRLDLERGQLKIKDKLYNISSDEKHLFDGFLHCIHSNSGVPMPNIEEYYTIKTDSFLWNIKSTRYCGNPNTLYALKVEARYSDVTVNNYIWRNERFASDYPLYYTGDELLLSDVLEKLK